MIIKFMHTKLWKRRERETPVCLCVLAKHSHDLQHHSHKNHRTWSGAYMRQMYIAQVHECVHCTAKHAKSVLELFNFFFANLFLSSLFLVYFHVKVFTLNMWEPLVAVGPTLIKFQISRKVFLFVCSLIHSFLFIAPVTENGHGNVWQSRSDQITHKTSEKKRSNRCAIKVE